jgi:hypothetical protein
VKAGAGAAPKAPLNQPPKQPSTNPAKAASPQNDLEIQTIHAWGEYFVLTSDTEALNVYGNDLFYNAQIKQNIMKGQPLRVDKETNRIVTPELVMNNFDDPLKQNTRARGPVKIGMGEIDPKTKEHSQQAHCGDWLVVTKVKENGKDLDSMPDSTTQ